MTLVALVGAIAGPIGAIVALATAVFAYRADRRKQVLAEEGERNSETRALRAELQAVTDRERAMASKVIQLEAKVATLEQAAREQAGALTAAKDEAVYWRRRWEETRA